MTEPIKILRLIARLNVGGPAIHVSLLTQKLRPPHYESTLACGTIDADEGDMQYYAEERGVQPIVIPELGRSLHPLRDLITIYRVYRLIRRLRPDIVHTHTAKAGFVGRIAAWLAGVPVILHTFHGHVFHGYFSPLLTQVFLLLERLTARMSTAVITLSEDLRRDLSETYRIARKSKITVLPLGLDLDAFVNTPRRVGTFREQIGVAEISPLVGIVGRLVPVKNHALFLQAAARIHAARPDVHFVIVGDGELRRELEERVDALGLRAVVHFTGWMRDLTSVYSDLDVLVISSINEGTPVSVIEALASGCPVVATAVGGLRDLLENGALGTLVADHDPDALAAAVSAVIAQPAMHLDIAARARPRMVERYGIDRLVQDLDELYRALLTRARQRRR